MLAVHVTDLPLTQQQHSLKCKRCMIAKVKVKSVYEPIVAHQVRAYPSFYSMKQIGVFLLPPGWDASLSQGYPSPSISSLVPIYTPGWREASQEESVLPKNTTQCRWPSLKPRPLNPESSALTKRPSRLPPKSV